MQDPEEVDKTCAMFGRDVAFGGFDMRKEGYRMRVVGTQEELLEKLRIFDAGLDDRIIELLKIMVSTVVMRDQPDAKSVREVFYQHEGENRIGIWVDGKPLGDAPVTSRAYEETAQEFKKELQEPQANVPLIDKHWAAGFYDIAGDDRFRAYLG